MYILVGAVCPRCFRASEPEITGPTCATTRRKDTVMSYKDALVSEEMAAKFATEKDTPYYPGMGREIDSPIL